MLALIAAARKLAGAEHCLIARGTGGRQQAYHQGEWVAASGQWQIVVNGCLWIFAPTTLGSLGTNFQKQNNDVRGIETTPLDSHDIVIRYNNFDKLSGLAIDISHNKKLRTLGYNLMASKICLAKLMIVTGVVRLRMSGSLTQSKTQKITE